MLTDLSNLPTATDIANDVVAALTGPGGALTTIETDLTNLPSTLTTDLIGALTGAGDPLTLIETDLTSLLSTDTIYHGRSSDYFGRSKRASVHFNFGHLRRQARMLGLLGPSIGAAI